MIKKNKIPTILGIILLFAGVFAGVILLRNSQVFKIGANPTITPKDVRVGSLSDSSATVSWVTADATIDFISYGLSPGVGTVVSETQDDQKFFTHSITISGLNPETVYYFKINSEGTLFDNNGIPWQFTTGKALSINQISIPISGSVITADGQPSGRAIVYVNVGGYTISSLTSESGNYILQLGSARTPDLSTYAQIDPAATLLEISVTSASGETATAKIFPQSANPVPALIIGQDKDFRNLPPSANGQNPDANLNLPETATTESKFNVEGTKAGNSANVTLESVTEGEIISSDKPEFIGDGPTGTKITIAIHSETALSGTTTIASNGSWKWSPPANLSEGAHSITVSWIDASGITRTLTRNFIVQAGELPAFVATPSATPTGSPTPTPKPTKTPVSTATPTATPVKTPSSTIKPTASVSATPASLPDSGSLTPTILLFMMGLGVIVFSFYTWKVSEK